MIDFKRHMHDRVTEPDATPSTRYAASAPTPAASAVLALMSSTPGSPWIPTSESILRYRALATGDVLGHPVTKIGWADMLTK
jgi:hypothetical protein